MVAPHELDPRELDEVLEAADWAWVHLTSAGVDFVDLGSWPPDRLLTRSWQCYAAPLAEYALGSMLAHEWRDGAPWSATGVAAGRGLWGARVGVAGWGAVGRRVAAVAAALGAEVRVLSRTARPTEGRVSHTTRIEDVLDGDHLVIALPLTGTTERLFDDERLADARNGLHVVNISRAGIVDQDALADLCRAGRLAATLDVTAPEPLPARHPLRALPSIRYSPHVAWRSRDSEFAFVEDVRSAWAALETGAGEVPGRIAGTSAQRARNAVAATAARA